MHTPNLDQTRSAVFEKLDARPDEIVEAAKQNGNTVIQEIQEQAPKCENSWNHPVAAYDYLYSKGIRLYAEGRRGSSRLSKFKDPGTSTVLLDHVESRWQGSFSPHKNVQPKLKFDTPDDEVKAMKLSQSRKDTNLSYEARQQLEESGTITGFTANTIYRPMQDGMIDTPPFMIEIPYDDIAEVIVLDTIDFRAAAYEVSDEDQMMLHTPEGTPSATIKLAIGEQRAEAFRHALGIEIGDSQMMSDTPVVVEGLRRMVEEIGMRQSDNYGRLVANDIAGINASQTAVALGSTVTEEDVATILNSLPATTQVVDRVIGDKVPILKYYIAARKFNTADNQVVGGGIVPMTRLGNRYGMIDVAYYFDHNLRSNMAVDTLYAYNKMHAACVLDYMRGEMDSTKFDPKTAMHGRYFARWQGHYLKHGGDVKQFTIS